MEVEFVHVGKNLFLGPNILPSDFSGGSQRGGTGIGINTHCVWRYRKEAFFFYGPLVRCQIGRGGLQLLSATGATAVCWSDHDYRSIGGQWLLCRGWSTHCGASESVPCKVLEQSAVNFLDPFDCSVLVRRVGDPEMRLQSFL